MASNSDGDDGQDQPPPTNDKLTKANPPPDTGAAAPGRGRDGQYSRIQQHRSTMGDSFSEMTSAETFVSKKDEAEAMGTLRTVAPEIYDTVVEHTKEGSKLSLEIARKDAQHRRDVRDKNLEMRSRWLEADIQVDIVSARVRAFSGFVLLPLVLIGLCVASIALNLPWVLYGAIAMAVVLTYQRRGDNTDEVEALPPEEEGEVHLDVEALEPNAE